MRHSIGVFAGTFDPIHEGHLAFAEAALQAGLEKVWFMVEPNPRKKQGVRSLEHRQAMVDLAIASNPKFGSIIINQPRFSAHETLPVLRARFAGFKLALLFGEDVTSHMSDWPHVAELSTSVELLVATRKKDNSKILQNMKYLEKARNLCFDYQILHAPKSEISSSSIRLALKHHRNTAGLPAPVLNYIQTHRLYTSGSASAFS